MAVSWSYFERFGSVTGKYLPDFGEGENMATQTVTAVAKLVYKWYNDGDVYDNRYMMEGWCNDLSSYANWIYKFVGDETGADVILDGIADCYNDGDYEDLLKELADTLYDEEWLGRISKNELIGSIYDCDGRFRFVDREEW